MPPIIISEKILELLLRCGPVVAPSVSSMIARHRAAKETLTVEAVLSDWNAELLVINRSYDEDIAAARARAATAAPLKPQPVPLVHAPAPDPSQVVTAGALQAAVATL